MSGKVTLDLHLISDSTCETVIAVARAALEHFKSVKGNEFVWSLIGNRRQIDKILSKIDPHRRNLVMYTMIDDHLREYLKERAMAQGVRCLPVLSHIIREISCYLQVDKDPNPTIYSNGLDDEYFTRMDAINYTISHDDGQSMWDVDQADIIIVGVSRTSKSPTSIYLAYRGYKVVNIPLVHSVELPIEPSAFVDKLIVGLTIDVSRLIRIRKNRLISMKNQSNYQYVSYEQVTEEVCEMERICMRNGWPVIDVTQKSVEEIAATIIQLFNKKSSRTLLGH